MSLEIKFTIPGQMPQVVPLDQMAMMVGTLLSNHIVIRAPGVEPIHALFEEHNGQWMVTDLGSESGVLLNQKKIEVESPFKHGDLIAIGSVLIEVHDQTSQDVVPAITPPPPPLEAAPLIAKPAEGTDALAKEDKTRFASTVAQKQGETPVKQARKDMLFSPREGRPSGNVLEVVAYWGDTILDVEHYEVGSKNYEVATIGVPPEAHFISAGKKNIQIHPLAKVTESGYTLKLVEGMEARLRKGGKVEKVSGGRHSLNRRDIAHIKYGPVRYFLLYVNPPELRLPRAKPEDKLFLGLIASSMLVYLLFLPFIWFSQPKDKENEDEDIWSIVHVPESIKPPPKVEVKKEEPPKVTVAEVKTPPPVKVPPPPPPPPPKPAPAKEVAEVKQPLPVEKPVEKPNPTKTLSPQPPTPNVPAPVTPPKPQNNTPDKSAGMAGVGSKSPDNKLPGPPLANTRRGPGGGPKGSGLNQAGAPRKGTDNASVAGVEGPKNKEASGVNLGALGLGVGKVFSNTGAGAIHTNFKSSAGGAGGGMGSGSKTLGLGGIGQGRSTGLAGDGGQVNNFGSGSGGLLSGDGGRGGTGLGDSFGRGGSGRGPVSVQVSPAAPAVSGGLTSQEVSQVIRANLNVIRHCYEKLLQRSPNASGKVTVAFEIAANGRVSTAQIANSSISDSTMQNCIVSNVRRWPFPAPRGGMPVSVSYPFSFSPL
jgi:TonB family protein